MRGAVVIIVRSEGPVMFQSSSGHELLPVIAVVRKVLLWTQQQQLAVEHEEAAVVAHAAVHDRQSHVADDAVRVAAAQQLLRHRRTSGM